jgi:acyl carrier protein
METPTTDLRGLDRIRDQVREFILQSFFYGHPADLVNDEMPLVEYGGVDQTGVLEIAEFIEETYGVQVAEGDLTPENFDSVEGIARFIWFGLANS